MSLADDLIAVRTVLVLWGRAVETLNDDEGRVCFGKAIKSVGQDFDSPRTQAMCLALVRHLPEPAPNDWERDVFSSDMNLIIHFNDRASTTDQDVFDVIDKALAELGAL